MALVEDVIELLLQRPMTAREICDALGIEPEREREVYAAIQKAARVVRRKGWRLMMNPPRCRKCGFEFDSIKASRCPRCKGERIEAARFFIET